MFREEEYENSDEPFACLEAMKNGCTWAGCLYKRKGGGVDLFYDHENSEFKPLDLGKITMLRHLSMAANGLVFVTRLDEERNQTRLLENAKRQLLAWIAATIGN